MAIAISASCADYAAVPGVAFEIMASALIDWRHLNV